MNPKQGTMMRHLYIVVIWFDVISGLDVKPQKERYLPDYSKYHNLSAIEKELQSIANRNLNYVKLDFSSFTSRQRRSQLFIHLSNFTGRNFNQISSYQETPRLKVLLSYGEHAREFLPIESMLHLVKNLTSGLSYHSGTPQELFSRKVLSNIDLYIISMANPDGRKHLEVTHNYCWRGTSTGVDLDRNFDWEFAGKGSSSNQNDEEYRGPEAFSEPETNVFTGLANRIKFDLFISFHSGIKHIYIPFSDTKSKISKRNPPNFENMLDLASILSHSTQYVYKYGHSYDLSGYTADGTIFDYMAGVKKVPFSFAVELWGTNHNGPSCFDLFNPKSEDLHEVVKTIHPMYAKLFSYLIEWKEAKIRHLSDPLSDAPSLTFGYVLLGCIVIITVITALHGRYPICNRLYQRRRIVSLKSLSSTFTMYTK
ncbi:hypothetical protein FSP39_009226 [Pinctada imbricata]|uniref:Peptidase M14 domain-containing protein n=1 Tax=Pinctada imbricata TaxID=66713 RepID=A0AA88XZA2_PINIB|nr:hypothetical protein FSP39_009226 [Pinctada imbricata]